MNKAQLERLTQLALAAQGKETKRPVKDILASERTLARNRIAQPPPAQTIQPPAEQEEGG